MRRALLLLALALLGSLVATPAPAAKRRPPNPAAAPRLATVERSRMLMGTVCTATVQGRGDSLATALALEAAFDEIARLEDVMSSWRGTSELARLNAATDERFTCSPDLFAVIDSALGAAHETDGAFDPTIEPLNRAWDVRGEGRVPPADEIAAARTRVAWRAVIREPSTRTVRFTRPGMAIDLGGIGKGYALDRVADVLRERGTARALVNFGGEILALSQREPWQVVVAHPVDRLVPAIRLALTNAALSTSAQSERGIVVGGVRYGHILDPTTGMPVRTGASVSVVARSATRADALSTALLVMGRERSAEFAAAHPSIGVLWLEPGGEGLRAWAWNLPSVAAEPGVNVLWLTRP